MKMKKIWTILLSIGIVLGLNGVSYAQEDWFVDCPELYTYAEMQQDIKKLSKKYGSSILKAGSLGVTIDGRQIYHIVMGNPNASKHILITGAIHGREYMTTRLVMKQLLKLCEGYAEGQEYQGISYAELLQQTAIHYVPMINPDGVTISQLGLDGMNHRATRQLIYQAYENDHAVELDQYLPKWKANAGGVDINRNFDALWEEYHKGPSQRSSDCYKGEQPGSEIESQALINLTEEYAFTATVSYHTQGKVIYWYFGQSGDCLEKNKELAELVSSLTGYPTFANYESLDPAGYKDWAIQKKQIPSLTIEVGTGTSPVDAGQFSAIWKENCEVVPALLFTLQGEKWDVNGY